MVVVLPLLVVVVVVLSLVVLVVVAAAGAAAAAGPCSCPGPHQAPHHPSPTCAAGTRSAATISLFSPRSSRGTLGSLLFTHFPKYIAAAYP